jgi:SAM-dependent methyltransferase
MRPSVVSLRQFYSSRLGRKIKQRLRQLALERWPDTAQEIIVGIGYAIPVLRVLERNKPAAMVAFMPADQGAIYWPVHSENHSVLGDELIPPFAVNSLHRVLMLHAFEHVARPLDLLNVYWQMLAPGGRLLVIVPNRRSYWASLEHTPFARGTPYSLGQMKELLDEAKFTMVDHGSALYAPPSSKRMWLNLWPLFESLGSHIFPGWGGVLIIEAEKQIYASIPEPVASPIKKWAVAAPVSAA